MWIDLLRFELRYQLRRPSVYISVAAVAIIAFLLITAIAQKAGESRTLVQFNSPISAARLLTGVNLFGLLIPLIIFARAALRDAETRMEELVRATPASFSLLMLTRFIVAFLLVTLIFIFIAPSMELALRMPWLDSQLAGTFRPAAYAQTYAILMLPNIFVFGSVAFVMALWTRSMAAAYVLLVLFVGLFVAANTTALKNSAYVGPLLDPFGGAALLRLTRYWSTAEQGANAIPVEGVLLWNRLIWVGIGAVLLAVTLWFVPRSAKGSRPQIIERLAPRSRGVPNRLRALPTGAVTAVDQFLLRLRYETATALRSWSFPAMLLLLAALCITTLKLPDPNTGVPFVPTTAMIAPQISGIAVTGGILMIVVLAGEIMWRERRRNISEILDATPVRNPVLLGGKFGALALVSVIYLSVATAVAVAYQLWFGQGSVQLSVYAMYMLFDAALPLLMFAILIMLLHTLAPNKYAGHFAVLCYIGISATAHAFGIEDGLLHFGSIPRLPMSEMNGFGQYLGVALWFTAYWGGVALLVGVATQLLWARGVPAPLIARMRNAPGQMTNGAIFIAACAALVAVLTGGFIYWNTHILHPYYTDRDIERLRAEYERRFRPELQKPQPRIAAIEMAVDIDPDRRLINARGTYNLINRAGTPIDEVRVQFDDELKVSRVELERSALASREPRFNDYVFRPESALMPGETLTLTFAGTASSAGFRHSENATPINANGTIATSLFFSPWIGVLPHLFLTDKVRRNKFGLPPLELVEREGMVDKNRNFLTPDSDFVRFGITLSTSPDQMAIAPGTLKKEWIEAGRHYYRYESDGPIINFWNVLSARYATGHATWRNVDLAVHYHPPQRQNVQRMLSAMQQSLAYYTKTFGPFPHSQLRIAEYPYGVMAQSFPAMITCAEGMGFMLDRRADAVDIVGFLTAHEVAHQWWGHQAVPADMPGAQFLSETLAEYSALMVMETLYGPDRIRAYLKTDLDQYLSHRGKGDAEQPLASVRFHQGYIAYKKGALAMYALKDAIGQAAIDKALRRYLEKYRNTSAPYPTAGDFLTILREEAGPDHQSLITDLFEHITFWDFKIYAAAAIRTDDGKWRVSVSVGGQKVNADEKGTERNVALRDNADIGLFAVDPSAADFTSHDVIALEKRPIKGSIASFEFVTDRKPAFAGINPYLKLTERNAQDNIISVP